MKLSNRVLEMEESVTLAASARAAALKAALRAGGVSLKAGSVPITDDLDLTIQGLVFG